MATKAKKRTTRKRRTSSKGSGSTVTLSGIRYTRSSCHTSKAAATKKAKSIRASGYTARVVGKCVYKGRKRKK